MPQTALLTPVCNTSYGDGPGHSALVIGTKVYSFGDNGGWYVVAAKTYMADNSFRPVLVQHLNGAKVDGAAMLKYAKGSRDAGEWYIFSGLCNHQAAYAIDAATNETFEPSGFDTPYAVAVEVSQKKYETDRYVVLSSEKKSDAVAFKELSRLIRDFPNCPVGQPKFYEWTD